MNSFLDHQIDGICSISDNSRYYDFVCEKTQDHLYIHCPIFRPEIYNTDMPTNYRIDISYWQDWEEKGIYSDIWNRSDCIAEPSFRYINNEYTERWELPVVLPNKQIYISITPVIWVGGKWIQDKRYDSGQGAIVDRCELGAVLEESNGSLKVSMKWNGEQLNMSINDFCNAYYGKGQYSYKLRAYVSDKDNCYDAVETEVSDKDIPVLSFNNVLLKFKNWSDYKEGLRIQGVIVIYKLINDEKVKFLGIRTDPYYLTEQNYGKSIIINELTGTYIDIVNNAKDMKYIKPRIINKTVQKVINMTSRSDSKSNIIQPVFFQTRPLGMIVIHPEVTENISINLDAYKSQVDSFTLKVAGATFGEVGRTDSGVIFRVLGNMLQNTSTAGTYYILDQDANLVTTGKYQTEV